MFDKRAIYVVCGVVVVLFMAYSIKDLIEVEFEVPAPLYLMMSAIVTAAITLATKVGIEGVKKKEDKNDEE